METSPGLPPPVLGDASDVTTSLEVEDDGGSKGLDTTAASLEGEPYGDRADDLTGGQGSEGMDATPTEADAPEGDDSATVGDSTNPTADVDRASTGGEDAPGVDGDVGEPAGGGEPTEMSPDESTREVSDKSPKEDDLTAGPAPDADGLRDSPDNKGGKASTAEADTDPAPAAYGSTEADDGAGGPASSPEPEGAGKAGDEDSAGGAPEGAADASYEEPTLGVADESSAQVGDDGSGAVAAPEYDTAALQDDSRGPSAPGLGPEPEGGEAGAGEAGAAAGPAQEASSSGPVETPEAGVRRSDSAASSRRSGAASVAGDDVRPPSRAPSTAGDVRVASRTPSTAGEARPPSRTPSVPGELQVASRAPSTTGDVRVASRAPSTTGEAQVASRRPSTTGEARVVSRTPSIAGDPRVASRAPSASGEVKVASRTPSAVGGMRPPSRALSAAGSSASAARSGDGAAGVGALAGETSQAGDADAADVASPRADDGEVSGREAAAGDDGAEASPRRPESASPDGAAAATGEQLGYDGRASTDGCTTSASARPSSSNSVGQRTTGDARRAESASSSESRPPLPNGSSALTASASALARQLSADMRSNSARRRLGSAAASPVGGSRTSSRPASGMASTAAAAAASGDGGGGSRAASRPGSATSAARGEPTEPAAGGLAVSESRLRSSSGAAAAGDGAANSTDEVTGDGEGVDTVGADGNGGDVTGADDGGSRPGSVTYAWRGSAAGDVSSPAGSRPGSAALGAAAAAPSSQNSFSEPVGADGDGDRTADDGGLAAAMVSAPPAAAALSRNPSQVADGRIARERSGPLSTGFSSPQSFSHRSVSQGGPANTSFSSRPPLANSPSTVNLGLGRRPRSAVLAPAGDSAAAAEAARAQNHRSHYLPTHVQPKGPMDECTVQAASQHVRTVWSTSNICGIRSLPNALSPDFRDRLYEELVQAAHREKERKATSTDHKPSLSYGLEGGPLSMPLSVGQKQVARIHPLSGMFTQYEYLPSEYDRMKLTGKYDRLKHKLAKICPSEFIVRAPPQALRGAPAFSEFTYATDPVDSYTSSMHADADLARSRVVAGPFYPAGRISSAQVLKGRVDECMMRLCKTLSQDWPASFLQVFEDRNGSVVLSLHKGRAVAEGDLSSYMNTLAKQNHTVATYQLLKDATRWGLVDEATQAVFYVMWPPWVRHKYLGPHTRAPAAPAEAPCERPATRGSSSSDEEGGGLSDGMGPPGQGPGYGMAAEPGEGMAGASGAVSAFGDQYGGHSSSQLRLGPF